MDRGEMAVELGGQVRHLNFGVSEICLLEDKLLESGVLSWLQKHPDMPLPFCTKAVFAGLSKKARANRVTIETVEDWFKVGVFKGSLMKLQQEILFAIVSGTPGMEAEQVAKVMDQAFKNFTKDVTDEAIKEPSADPTPAV